MSTHISKQNTIVKHLVKLVSTASYRYKSGQCVIFGDILIKEISSFSSIKTLISLQENSIKAEEKYIASEEVLKKITKLPSMQGPVALVSLPNFVDISKKKKIVIIDGVKDPGNLGTILRSALAFGFEGVHLTKECCDPFNDKVIRSAKGANFVLPISYEPFTKLELSNFYLLLAHMEGTNSKDIILDDKPYALLLSNESTGLDPKWDGEKISIATSKKTESLNVAIAASILFYELANRDEFMR